MLSSVCLTADGTGGYSWYKVLIGCVFVCVWAGWVGGGVSSEKVVHSNPRAGILSLEKFWTFLTYHCG